MIKNKAITKEDQGILSPSVALQELLDGNNRFVNNTKQITDDRSLIAQTSSGQYPKAVILSCIDSRVPVEQVFDQAIGDVFVARVAGNFENVDILGSMEYSCKVAGSKLILVLGHEGCGAVKAACDGVELGNITAMLENIMPAVRLSAEEIEGEANSSNSAFVTRSVENNVKLTIDRIRDKSPILKEMEVNNEIEIAGGVYDIGTGKVRLI